MTDIIWIASSSVLIIAVLIIRAAFGKRMSAGLRYALWGVVLLRLFIPGTVFQSPVSVQNAVLHAEPARVYETAKDYSAFEEADDGVIAIPRESGRTAVVMPKASQERAETLNKAVKARDVLTVVWCTGMGMMGAYLLYVNVRFYMKLRDRRKLLSADAPCKVYSVEGLESSCLFLNSIYVSAETADDADLLNCVLAHELSHRRHGDGIFTLLRGAALVLHWYNPFVWAAAYASRQDSELFADAGALKELGEERRETYGRTLIDLSLRPSVRASIACTATSMANNKHALTERVKNVASRRRMGVIIAAVVLILALAAAGCAFLGSAKADEPAPYVPKTTDGPDARATDEPTDAPTAEPNAMPDEDWFGDRAFEEAEKIRALYGLENLIFIRKVQFYEEEEGVPVGVTVGGEYTGEYDMMELIFTQDPGASSKWGVTRAYLYPGETGGWDQDKHNEAAFERDDFGGNFNFLFPDEDLINAGYSVTGGMEDMDNGAALALDMIAERLTGLDEGNLMRCREAKLIGLTLDADNPDPEYFRYDALIAVLPENPYYFHFEFADALNGLYCGERTDCRYWYQLKAELAVGRDEYGQVVVFAELPDYDTGGDDPDPTEVPEKTGSELIDMAWAVAQQLGRVHQQRFNKERARIELSTGAVEVCFPSVTYPDEELWITLERDENGNYAAIPEDTYALCASEAFDSRLDSDLLAEKRAEFENARITVTADEIRASGCGAEVGSDEYKAAAAALYGEKLAGYYRESLSADTQFGCYETAFVGAEEGDYEDSYYVIIGFRVRDLLPFSILFDYEPSCDRGVRHRGFEGWLTGSTLVDVELAADGSFTCNAVLNGAG